LKSEESLKIALRRHQSQLAKCRRCPDMLGNPVYGYANVSPVMLIGQAPGIKEMEVNRPFAWTAGKTLFKWLDSVGLSEDAVRTQVYMAAVCRCFPGKNPNGGDRVPDASEIAQCTTWLHREIQLLRPKLLIPVGKLAIAQFITVNKLNQVVGRQHKVNLAAVAAAEAATWCDLIPLPHPSGASTWHRTAPGKELLQQALDLLKIHPAWQALAARQAPPNPSMISS